MSDFSVVVAALELVVGDTKAVQVLKGFEADYASVAEERDALQNRATALEAALERSQSYASALVASINRVREDAADGVLDNPVEVPADDPAPVDEPAPEPVPAPVA